MLGRDSPPRKLNFFFYVLMFRNAFGTKPNPLSRRTPEPLPFGSGGLKHFFASPRLLRSASDRDLGWT